MKKSKDLKVKKQTGEGVYLINDEFLTWAEYKKLINPKKKKEVENETEN